MAPELHTNRLILRPHAIGDFADCRMLWSDADVVRHIGGQPQDAQAVWFRMLRYAGMWAMLGYGMWAVEDRATGAFLGEAGLLRALRGIPELEDHPEVGWVFAPPTWGKGLASEAVAAVLDWADTCLDEASLRCIIAPGNASSIKVAQKLGFIELREASVHGAPTIVFDRVRRLAG